MSDNTGDESLHVPSLRIEGFRGTFVLKAIR